MSKALTIKAENQSKLMPPNADKDKRYRLQAYINWLDETNRNWSKPDLDAYAHYLQNDYRGKRGKPMSASTAKVHLSVIRSQYQKLLRSNDLRTMLYSMTDENTSHADKYAFVTEALTQLANAVHPDNGQVKVIKKQDQLDSDHLRLTDEQIKKLIDKPKLDTVLGIRDTAIIALMICTAIRENELVNLDVSDLRQTVNDELVLSIRSGKGAKARVIPYGSNSWCLVFVDLWLKVSGITEGALFRGMRKGDKVTSNRIHVRAINQIMERRQIEIGGKQIKVNPHDLRRTCAKRWYMNGMDITAIRDNLGHADIRTTQGYIGSMDMSERTPKNGLDIDTEPALEMLNG